MARRILRAFGSAVLVGALMAGGCTPSPKAAAEAAVSDPAVQDLLRVVPADTPYAWVGMSGSTRPFAEKLGKKVEPLLKEAEVALSQALAGSSQSDKPAEKVVRALGAELQGKLSVAGLESLGLEFDTRFVIYGLGLLPAMRLRLKDATLLKATIDRVQQASGVQFPVANHAGQDYWHGGDSKFEFVAAFVGNDVVMGVVATATKDRMLPVLFGQEKPASSLADVSVLKDVVAAHGLGQYSAGFVDVRILVDALVGAGTGYNQETAAAVLSGETPTPECAAELRGLAGVMPRIVFGTTRIDDSGVETRVIAELRPDIAGGLASVRASVPGLDGATSKEVMFGMGSGVDVGQAIELAKTQAMVVEAAPFKCRELSFLNDAAREIVRGAPNVPPPVRQFKGFALALEDASFAGFLPTNVKGYMTVGTAEPLAMIKTLKSFAPSELAFIPDLAQEGVGERLNLAALPLPLPIPFEMFLAGRRDAGLALAVGADAQKRSSDLLVVNGEAKPLFVFHMNLGRFMKMLPSGANVPNAAVFDLIGSQGYVLDAGEGGLVARSWLNFPE